MRIPSGIPALPLIAAWFTYGVLLSNLNSLDDIRRHHQSDGTALIWAAFFSIVAGWAILTHPPGYHWIVAILLAVLAIWQFRRWQHLCAMNVRLKNLMERHAIGQLFGQRPNESVNRARNAGRSDTIYSQLVTAAPS